MNSHHSTSPLANLQTHADLRSSGAGLVGLGGGEYTSHGIHSAYMGQVLSAQRRTEEPLDTQEKGKSENDDNSPVKEKEGEKDIWEME